MKSFMTDLAELVLVTALAVGCIFWVTRESHLNWPGFTGSAATGSPLAPEVVTEYDRDFGWRIGDVIPIRIFLEQKPGTYVDLHSLAMEGDFQMARNADPEIITRDFKDGKRHIGISFKIQSMSGAKQLALKLSMLYRVLETSQDHPIEIPVFNPYTSPTWDGRDLIQDGKPEYLHENHLLWTMAFMIFGIAGCVLAQDQKKRWQMDIVADKKQAWDTRRQIARREFDAVWAGFEAGDFSIENYKAVARCVRKLFRIQSKVRWEIEIELGGGHPHRDETLRILDLTGRVLYGKGEALTGEEHLSIKAMFDRIVPPQQEVSGPDNEP